MQRVRGHVRTAFSASFFFAPTGDQPAAIDELVANLNAGIRDQVLLGVTRFRQDVHHGHVIARTNRPALILAHNKTLAASALRRVPRAFSQKRGGIFRSYYDYYQPEAYVPSSDTYIEKDSAINDNIDKLRHAATHALLTRRDVIIVASVSCIYGLGSPEYYARLIIPVEEGQNVSMESIISRLVDIQYTRNDYDFHRGTFRVRGDVLEIIPAYEDEKGPAHRNSSATKSTPCAKLIRSPARCWGRISKTVIYPASHYVSDRTTSCAP